jgi:hypothetical protein
MPIKKVIPVRKDRAKDDFILLSFIDISKGIRAIQARNSRSNLGKDKIRSRAEARDKRILILSIQGY